MRAEVAQVILNILNQTPIQATVGQIKEGTNALLDEAIADLTELSKVEAAPVAEEAPEEAKA